MIGHSDRDLPQPALEALTTFTRELNGWLKDLGADCANAEDAARLFEFGATPRDAADLLCDERQSEKRAASREAGSDTERSRAITHRIPEKRTIFYEGSPEPVAWAVINGNGDVVHVFFIGAQARNYAAAGGYTVEALFRGVPASTRAAHDVLTERWRQTAIERFDYYHDDKHESGELAQAGACYALAAAVTDLQQGVSKKPPTAWPWEAAWWKPGTARRMLVKACALLLSDIERIDRKAQREDTRRVRA